MPEFFSQACSQHCHQEGAAPKQPHNSGCGSRAQLLYGTGGMHRGQGQGTRRGLLYHSQRCLCPGTSGTERHKSRLEKGCFNRGASRGRYRTLTNWEKPGEKRKAGNTMLKLIGNYRGGEQFKQPNGILRNTIMTGKFWRKGQEGLTWFLLGGGTGNIQEQRSSLWEDGKPGQSQQHLRCKGTVH